MNMTKLPTGISGLDLIACGGLPEGRSTLVSGTSGSAKTVLACQFLVEGIRGITGILSGHFTYRLVGEGAEAKGEG